MESFSELIKARRSMRKFTEEELTQEQVVTLMKAALMAPTSKRSNAWQFIVVDEKDKLKELSYCKEQASQFIADAALAVVVVADPLASDVWIEDASIASIYLQLQTEDMGLGSCWVQVRERFRSSDFPGPEGTASGEKSGRAAASSEHDCEERRGSFPGRLPGRRSGNCFTNAGEYCKIKRSGFCGSPFNGRRRGPSFPDR